MEQHEDQQPQEPRINSGGGNVNSGEIRADKGDVVLGDKITKNYYPPSEKVVPNQLPSRRTQTFVGRADSLNRIKNSLKTQETLVVIGPGGMGKTTLAVEAIHQIGDNLPERFPDGIIFHTFYGRPELSYAFDTLIRAYGGDTRGDLEQLARQTLGGKRALVILDGCEELDVDGGLRKITDLLGNCGVLMTTREPKHGAMGHQLDLERLSTVDGVILLTKLARPNPISVDVGKEICKQVDHLPLAVDIAGRYLGLQRETADSYLAWLKEKPFEALKQGETQRDSMYRLVNRSVEKLDDVSQTVLALLGQLAYLPVPIWLLEGVLEAGPRSLNDYFDQLTRYGLTEWQMGQVTCAHALVHGYGRGKHKPEAVDGGGLAAKLFEWLNKNLRAWQEAPPQFDKCDAVRGHAMTLLARLEEKEAWEQANDLVWALGSGGGYLSLQGHFAENIIAHETGVRVCQQMGNRKDENAHLNHLGMIFHNIGQVEKAIGYFEQGLEISREMEDKRAEGAQLGNLGLAVASLGRVEEAIGYYEQALVISREIGDRRGEGNDLGNLGNAYSSLGRVEEAIGYYEQALVIRREIGDRRWEGADLGNLGIAYKNLGRVEEAIDYYEQALVISREIGDRRGEGNQLGNLGNAVASLGRVEEAIDYYKQALVISREIGDRRGEGNRLGNLGNAYSSLGRVEEAIGYHEQALVIQREIGDRRGEGNQLGNLGNAYANLGQVEKAMGFYEQGVLIQKEIGDIQGVATKLANMGLRYKNDLGDPAKAKTLWQEALAIFEQIGSPYADLVRGWLNDLE